MKALEIEVGLIRALFFQFFVEAVVATVKGEEEIWLLESGHVSRLYRWKRARPKNSGTQLGVGEQLTN
ncbi:MAG TPA: hypothetical protein V6D08_03730 [Candidatus Obscuribacterales bacterium]